MTANSHRFSLMFCKCLALLLLMTVTSSMTMSAAALRQLPEPSLKKPELLQEESVSTYVPSEAAPGQGLAVNVIYPEKARYEKEAPVVVVVPGGTVRSGLGFSMHAAQAGFIEIRFAFPGAGIKEFQSTGIFDNGGVQCQRALKDVLRFAAGKLPDIQGRTVGQVVPVKAAPGNVGLIGWSTGANVTLATLGRFPKELSFVKWVGLYEPAAGAMISTGQLGTIKDLFANKHYRRGSAATGDVVLDYRRLQWQPVVRRNPGVRKKLGEPEVPGVLFFDENQNGIWDESLEYALSYSTDVGVEKQFYPPEVIGAALRMHLFLDPETSAKLIAKYEREKSSKSGSSSGGARPAAGTKSGAPDGRGAVTDSAPDATAARGAGSASGDIAQPAPTATGDGKAPQKIGAAQALRNKILPPGVKLTDFVPFLSKQGQNAPSEKAKKKTDSFGFPTSSKTTSLFPTSASATAAFGAVGGAAAAAAGGDASSYKLWPKEIATLAESEAYFKGRDGWLAIPAICQSYPNLLVTIFGSQVDHLQRQPDHPHITHLYNSFVSCKSNWVRLNPDPLYLAQIGQMNASNFVNNAPNDGIDAAAMDSHLEPEGLMPDYVFMEALVAELADRTKDENLKTLEKVIVEYYNSANPPPVVKKPDDESIE